MAKFKGESSFGKDQVTLMKTKSIEKICIGIIAKNMGYANQTNVCKSGEAVFEYIGSMTYKEFRNVKKLINGTNMDSKYSNKRLTLKL
jgi:hypothetical protein